MKSLYKITVVLTVLVVVGRIWADEPEKLDLALARDLAMKTHPRISVAELRAMAAREVVTQSHAGFFPTIAANATAVGTGETVTRIAAGSLSNSQIYNRVGVGATISQLITDFGRTSNVTEAAKKRARAADEGVLATRAQLLLEVDRVYFSALEARAIKGVAAKTLSMRRLLLDQISTMASNQLKSDLDVRFARVGVDEAKLLADQAEKDWQSALASLATLIGKTDVAKYDLQEDTSMRSEVPNDPVPLIALALRQRHDLLQQRSERDAARNVAKATRGLRYPTISAFGTAGVVPIRDAHFEHDYAAGGINVNVPLFTGGLYRAKQREAELQADAADEALRDVENNVSRDVRIAWLEASHALERVSLTQSLLENATETLKLAKLRFEQGLSSIIELNQAELAQTSAEISWANAGYEYRGRLDVLDYQTGALR